MSNWRRDIRNARRPTNRPNTPPLLKSISKRAKNLNQKRFYQNSQLDWINFYNKLTDEYHKIEEEINSLGLNIDTENNLHRQIGQDREDYTYWKEYIGNTLSTVYSNDNVSYLHLQNVKHEMNTNENKLNIEQKEVERQLQQIQKTIVSLDNEKENDPNKDKNGISMRRENVKYHEFCLKNDINSRNKYGGWSQDDHQKFITILQQYKAITLAELFEKLQLFFPDKSKIAIKKHHDWHRLHSQHISTNKRMKSQRRTKHKLLAKRAKSEELIENTLKRLNQEEIHKKELFDSKLNDLHNKVEQIQEIRNEKMMQEQLLENKRMEENRLKQLEEQTKWNEYRNQQKEKLNIYYNDKIAMLEIKQIEDELQRERDRVKQRESNKINKKRVEYRENKRNERIKLHKEAILKYEEQKQIKEERLSKLRMKVRDNLDHDKIDNICGVLKNTKNVTNRLNKSQHDNYSDGIVNMYPNHGYSDDKLFNDPKFALMHRLVESNLHNNKYAKQCLNNVNTTIQSRKDCNHSDVF